MKQLLAILMWMVGVRLLLPAQTPTFPQVQESYTSNRIVVRFEQPVFPQGLQTGIAEIDSYIRLHRISNIQPVFPFVPFPKHAGEHGLRQIFYFYYETGRDPRRVAAAFHKLAGIAYAEPEYRYSNTGVPQDPQYERQKFLGWIQAEEAWDLTKGEDGDVVIAVVDGGTEWQHEDLIDNIWTNPNEIADNGIDDDQNGFVDDIHGWNFPHDQPDPSGPIYKPESADHGTHVGGIAGAVTDNNIGVSSLSWNCKMMPINVADATTDQIIAYGAHGILYATLNGADIINCSFGGRGRSRLWQEIIDFATSRGSLVVAAAGNSANNNDLIDFYPAGYQHVLSVGATDQTNDTIATYSNFGSSVDVFAAGSFVRSTITGNQYASFIGTSMASPMVSALAGLVKTRFPSLSPDQIAERIRQTSDEIRSANIAKGDSVGRGRINALRALQALETPGIRILETEILRAGDDQEISVGDTVDLSISLINYLAPSNPTFYRLETASPDLEFTTNTAMLGSLNTLEEDTIHFSFVADSMLESRRFPFFLHLSDSLDYEDILYFALISERAGPSVLTHRTDSITFSITDEGNLGWLAQENSLGVGWEYQGDQLLFEAGLVMGKGPDRVLRTIRLDSSGTQAEPLRVENGLGLFESSIFNEIGQVIYADSTNTFSDDLLIEQLTLAGFPDNPELDNSAIIVYNLINLGRMPIRDLSVGIFADWNLRTDRMDFGLVDSADRRIRIFDRADHDGRLVYMHSMSEQYDFRGGLLTENGALAGTFEDAALWSYLESGSLQSAVQSENLSAIVAAGSVNIPVFDQVEVGFLITTASSELFAHEAYRSGRRIFKRNFRPLNPAPPVGIDENEIHDPLALSLYPNPANEYLNIHFHMSASEYVFMGLYDGMGRKVADVFEGKLPLGQHEIKWQQHAGNKLSEGIYWLRWESPSFQTSRAVLIE